MTLSVYAVADGYNVAEGSLLTLDPQPALPELIQASDYEYYADLSVQPIGVEHATLTWNAAVSQAERNAILSKFQLSDTVASNQITINLLQNDRSWLRCNAVAQYVRQDQRRVYGVANLLIDLVGIEPAS